VSALAGILTACSEKQASMNRTREKLLQPKALLKMKRLQAGSFFVWLFLCDEIVVVCVVHLPRSVSPVCQPFSDPNTPLVESQEGSDSYSETNLERFSEPANHLMLYK